MYGIGGYETILNYTVTVSQLKQRNFNQTYLRVFWSQKENVGHGKRFAC